MMLLSTSQMQSLSTHRHVQAKTDEPF